MYCGCNKTALSSQKQIADAFVKLLREHPYSEISISAVCKEAGISRQTFYTLFESKENLIVYELDRTNSFTPGQTCTKEEMSLRELCREYSTYITEREEFLSLLARNGIFYLMHDCLYRSFMECHCFLPDRTGTERTFIAEFVAGGLSGIARVYIQKGDGMTREQLEDTIYGLFSGELL